MKNITLIKNFLFNGITLGLLTVGFYSCSSTQQAYNDDDGIYGSDQPQQEVVMVRDTKTDYYQNYFSGEKDNNEEFFTDIDAYQGNYESDTVYVDEYNSNPPWDSRSSNVSISFNVGIGAGYGWGPPCYGWGGYYGWGYPCYGYGYGWGYGWGWGWGYPGYGYYPPYYPPYYPGYYERATYGKRYAQNTGRMNTGRLNRTDSFTGRSSRSGSRNVASNYSSRTGRNSSYTGSRNSRSSARNNSSSYSKRSSYSRTNNNPGYRNNSRSNNSRSYNRSSSPSGRSYSPSSRGSSSGFRSGSSGMRSSSGRRQMSYNNVNNGAGNSSNRTFIKRTQESTQKNTGARVSYANARSNGKMERYTKYTPSVTQGTKYSRASSSNSNSSGSNSSRLSSSRSSSRSSSSVSSSRSSNTSSANRSSAPSRSFKGSATRVSRSSSKK